MYQRHGQKISAKGNNAHIYSAATAAAYLGRFADIVTCLIKQPSARHQTSNEKT